MPEKLSRVRQDRSHNNMVAKGHNDAAMVFN